VRPSSTITSQHEEAFDCQVISVAQIERHISRRHAATLHCWNSGDFRCKRRGTRVADKWDRTKPPFHGKHSSATHPYRWPDGPGQAGRPEARPGKSCLSPTRHDAKRARASPALCPCRSWAVIQARRAGPARPV
jgi:hypothetical protein